MKEINLSNGYDKYLEYLNSQTWAQIRNKALERDKYECSICHSPHNLEVHHLKYPDVLGTEPLSDLMTLCRDCHKKLEDYKKGHTAMRYMTAWRPPNPPAAPAWRLWVRVKNREAANELIDCANSVLVHQFEDSCGGTSSIIIYLDGEKLKKSIIRDITHYDIEVAKEFFEKFSCVMDTKIVKE